MKISLKYRYLFEDFKKLIYTCINYDLGVCNNADILMDMIIGYNKVIRLDGYSIPNFIFKGLKNF